jgi:membrane protein DedA with SNARE-associated domain
MQNIPVFLTYSLNAVIYLKYVLVFIGAIVEGPILMVVSGFLLHEGAFGLVPLFLALVLGDLVGDVVWYYIGYYFADKFIEKHGRLFGLTIPTFEKAKKFFFKHHIKILLAAITTIFNYSFSYFFYFCNNWIFPHINIPPLPSHRT